MTEPALEIVKYPDPCLRQKAAEITEFDADLATLAEAMLALMKESNGVGLAGPQVGILKRIFVCNHTGEPQDDLVLINPQLSNLEGNESLEEGCLSLPQVSVPVRRAVSCHVRAQDVHGQPFEMDGEDLLARVWQHENDHLNGRMIIDFMDETTRLANRKALKHLEETYQR